MERSSPSVPRPAIVTGVGFLYISLAVMTGLSATLVVAASRYSDLADSGFWVIRHAESIVFLEGLIAVAMLIGAIGFLKQARWARTLLESITWLGLLYCIVGGGTLLNSAPRGWTATPVLVLIVAFLGVIGLLIRILRSSTVRGVMR